MPSRVLSSSVSAAPASDGQAGRAGRYRIARPDRRGGEVPLLHQPAQQGLRRASGPSRAPRRPPRRRPARSSSFAARRSSSPSTRRSSTARGLRVTCHLPERLRDTSHDYKYRQRGLFVNGVLLEFSGGSAQRSITRFETSLRVVVLVALNHGAERSAYVLGRWPRKGADGGK